MYKARQYLNKKALLNIYYSYICPYFIYCIEVWGNQGRQTEGGGGWGGLNPPEF